MPKGRVLEDLQVSVVKLNDDIYKRIGIQQPSVPELLRMTENDKPTWDMYANGWTLGLNQAEKEKSTEKVMRYKPKNISELSAFVAGIRPGFASMAPKLFNRENFTYGIPALDQMIQTREMPNSFILYQEQVMMILQWAGFQPSESYAAIKAIAKKHPEKVLPMKERFLKGFTERLVREAGVKKEDAPKTSDTVWRIIEDNTSYSFNASHSVSVALDSLYTAWAKAHHPYETYVSLLSLYAEKKDKERIAKAKIEMRKAFGISIVPCKFRQDNRSYFVDKDAHTISDALTSVKGISSRVANALWLRSKHHYDCAVDLFYDLEMDPAFTSQSITTLIMMGYFSEFGGNAKLLNLYDEFRNGESKFSKAHIKATQEKRLDALRFTESIMEDEELPPAQQIAFETEYYGTPISIYPTESGKFAILDVDEKYSPKIKMYNIAKGTTGIMKVKKSFFNEHPLKIGNVIDLLEWDRKPAYQYANGERAIKPGIFDLWMRQYKIIS